MSEPILRKCCGEEPTVHHVFNKRESISYRFVKCELCGQQTTGFETAEEAIDAWDTGFTKSNSQRAEDALNEALQLLGAHWESALIVVCQRDNAHGDDDEKTRYYGPRSHAIGLAQVAAQTLLQMPEKVKAVTL